MINHPVAAHVGFVQRYSIMDVMNVVEIAALPGRRASTIVTSTSADLHELAARLLPINPRPPVISTDRLLFAKGTRHRGLIMTVKGPLSSPR